MSSRDARPLLFRGGHLLTMDPAPGEDPEGLGAIRDGVLLVRDGRIAWVGRESDLPLEEVRDAEEAGLEEVDLEGGWLTPGFIDCHTHLVFGGSRYDEFRRRQEGESYADIAASGGGILSTVRATRAASEEDLLASARRRFRQLVRSGVTALEIKSGYGLDTETEARMLRVATRLGREEGVRVKRTFLGAHALAPEFAGDRRGFLDLVVRETLPALVGEGVVDAVDAFAEGIAFTAEECEAVLTAGRAVGLDRRLHADQLTDGGGAALAARMGARSADHLEYTSAEGVRAMATAGTAAVLLPGAFYTLGESRMPPVESFRAAEIPMAVATDCNPGSSPQLSILLAMNMAAVLFGLSPAEALRGVTVVAAAVLGWGREMGHLRPGYRADLAAWEVDDPVELVYWQGGSPLRTSLAGGSVLYSRNGG